jgi:hypothetical protein
MLAGLKTGHYMEEKPKRPRVTATRGVPAAQRRRGNGTFRPVEITGVRESFGECVYVGGGSSDPLKRRRRARRAWPTDALGNEREACWPV